jgi:hypothetical protein
MNRFPSEKIQSMNPTTTVMLYIELLFDALVVCLSRSVPTAWGTPYPLDSSEILVFFGRYFLKNIVDRPQFFRLRDTPVSFKLTGFLPLIIMRTGVSRNQKIGGGVDDCFYNL